MARLHIGYVLALIRLRARSVAYGRLREAGQGLAEYALMLTLIAVVAISALIYLGGQVSTTLSATGAAFQPAASCTVHYREDGGSVCR